jgi:predicted anti-sigma-YlaC factor YlaD
MSEVTHENIHDRARQLISQERIEGISVPENTWLVAHLQECDSCADFARKTSAALRSLQTIPIALPAGLAERTQFRVGLRAQQLRQHEPRRRALWIAAGISWAAGVASAPYVWRLFAWLGEQAGVPKLVWEMGFGLWWAVPALIAAVVLLSEHEKQSGERYWLQRSQ